MDAIATAVASLHRARRGKGPERVRIHQHDGMLVVMAREVLSQMERVLVTAGRVEAVVAQRLAYAAVIAPELVSIVEDAMLREVQVHTFAFHCSPDLSVDVFVFAAPAERGGSESD